jgi:hypothetical protein
MDSASDAIRHLRQELVSKRTVVTVTEWSGKYQVPALVVHLVSHCIKSHFSSSCESSLA